MVTRRRKAFSRLSRRTLHIWKRSTTVLHVSDCKYRYPGLQRGSESLAQARCTDDYDRSRRFSVGGRSRVEDVGHIGEFLVAVPAGYRAETASDLLAVSPN